MALVEWVGRLHGCVVSEPFFLGSPAHATSIAALPHSDLRRGSDGEPGYVHVPVRDAAVAAWPEEEGASPGVL